jgi:hypothetical protein
MPQNMYEDESGPAAGVFEDVYLILLSMTCGSHLPASSSSSSHPLSPPCGRRSSSVPAAAAASCGWGQPHAGHALSISSTRYESAARPWRGGTSSSAIRAATSIGAHPDGDLVPAEPRIELPAVFTLFSEAAKTGAALFITSSGAAFLLSLFGGSVVARGSLRRGRRMGRGGRWCRRRGWGLLAQLVLSFSTEAPTGEGEMRERERG